MLLAPSQPAGASRWYGQPASWYLLSEPSSGAVKCSQVGANAQSPQTACFLVINTSDHSISPVLSTQSNWGHDAAENKGLIWPEINYC